ncbi:MAG: winged helix-turn-helix transcriptional regulator [Candidatus Omnitrophica bacterium]|nr:winged helix-turn-helix transcriptional regulator [Candidatus Omnitrophota bacterium]
MRIRKARQVVKSFADETRIRIISLLDKEPLNVTELCKIIGATQSSISKHLACLRLTGVVADKRKGLNVYYRLVESGNPDQRKLVNNIVKGLAAVEVTKSDETKLAKIINGRKKA